MTRQDPEGRRRRILEAAAEMIAEVGPGRVTHRGIAQRAGVAVGSTTYYFPTLADLVSEALELIGEQTRESLAGWTSWIDAAEDRVGALADLILEYLADRPRAIRENELYLAAARTPELQAAARIWRTELVALVGARTDPVAAYGVASLVDGVTAGALATGEVPERELLRAVLERLLEPHL